MPNQRAADKEFVGGYMASRSVKAFHAVVAELGMTQVDALEMFILEGIGCHETAR